MNQEILLLLQINPSSGEPIYRQVMEQIKRLIISGYLKAGDELPSVRQVAGNLEVNPMTISKAYSILEVTGMLERRRGKGMIVARNDQSNMNLEQRLEMLRPVLREAATQANQLSLPQDKVLKMFSKLLEESHE
jgi:GntR family transcriptional regulator